MEMKTELSTKNIIMKHFIAQPQYEQRGNLIATTGLDSLDDNWCVSIQDAELPEELQDSKDCAKRIAELLNEHYPCRLFNFVAFLAERGFDSKQGITDSTTTNHSNGKILIAVSSDNARAYNYSSSKPIFNGATPKTPIEAAVLLRLLGV